MSQYYYPPQIATSYPPQMWATNSATTYSYTITPATETVVNVNIAPTPTPKTEIEQLLCEVEAVCALAR